MITESDYECPICLADVAEDAPSCPSCGTTYDDTIEAGDAEASPIATPELSAKRRSVLRRHPLVVGAITVAMVLVGNTVFHGVQDASAASSLKTECADVYASAVADTKMMNEAKAFDRLRDGTGIQLWRNGAEDFVRNTQANEDCFSAHEKIGKRVNSKYTALWMLDAWQLAASLNCLNTTSYNCSTPTVIKPGIDSWTSPPITAPPNGASFRCRDGSLSYAQHSQGACSHHGGIGG